MKLDRVKNYNCISFDVFDTLVTRSYKQPSHLFKELEIQLPSSGIFINNFAQNRIQCEFDIRKCNNFQTEVTVAEIYNEIRKRLKISKEISEKIKDMELSLELTSIYVNSKLLRLIKEIRKINKQIIYITDTYLPYSFIESILISSGIMKIGDMLYVSCEIGKMKSSGELFDYVVSDLKINSKNLIHVGDNYHSDIKVACEKGISSLHYTEVIDNRYEKYNGDDLLASQLVSLSKITRLQCATIDSREQTIWDTTSCVSAPMIFFYVYWTLLRSIECNVNKVYFLSRDGQIMHLIAKKIIDKFFTGKIIANYLYVSRQALLLPALTELNNESFEWIMAPTSFLSPRIILKRLNIIPDEISNLLAKFEFHKSIDKHLNHLEREEFKKMLLSLEPFILGKAQEARELTRKYFQQEGLFSPGSFSVVDIGWSGTLQRSISRIMDLYGKNDPIFGFYFGLRARKKHKNIDRLYAWFTDNPIKRNLDKKTYIIPMTELFTAADHGGVKGYIEKNGAVHPVFMSDVNEFGVKWGIKLQQRAMLVYADNALILGKQKLMKIAHDYVGWIERTYDLFLTSPTSNEASVYGSFMDAEDQNESYYMMLARKYSIIELYKVIRNNYKHHHNEWREGAMKLTFANIKKLVGLFGRNNESAGVTTLQSDQFFYLTSFPRSGNTWTVNSLKDFLGAQRAEVMPSVYGGELLTINNGISIKVAGAYDPSLPVGIKTHMYFSEFERGNLPVSKVLYLLRDVRDVMISYYFYTYGFLKKDVDKAMNFSEDLFSDHLKKELPNYKNHITGWLKKYNGSLLLVRYEDMKSDYIGTLNRIKEFLSLEAHLTVEDVKKKNVDNFRKIDNFSSVLQGKNTDFYRKGIVGDWLNYYNDEHIDIVKNEVGYLLIDLGYEKDLEW